MNRNLASALAMGTVIAAAAAAAAATIFSSNAFADDITIDNTAFVSARSRADVKAELMRQPELVRAGASEWAMQRNQPPVSRSSYTAEQARNEYKSARQYVNALNAEDSGSAYFARTAPSRVNASAAMGGPAR